MGTVIFLGGNGHSAARLTGARKALRELAGAESGTEVTLLDLPYPGFEGRPRAVSADAFLHGITVDMEKQMEKSANQLVYATGIGGLIALCLRAQRLEFASIPLLLQAPVLWGLETRLFPRLMRRTPLRAMLPSLFDFPPFQHRFVRRYFTRPPGDAVRASFFHGYRQCASLPDLFAWFAPPMLRRLEAVFAEEPERLRDIGVWWGGCDRVVGQDELIKMQQALGVTWPLRVFASWGHYPMIDVPEEWARALRNTVESSGDFGVRIAGGEPL